MNLSLCFAGSVSFVELKAQVAELNEQFHKLRKRVYMAVPAMKPKLDKIMEVSTVKIDEE